METRGRLIFGMAMLAASGVCLPTYSFGFGLWDLAKAVGRMATEKPKVDRFLVDTERTLRQVMNAQAYMTLATASSVDREAMKTKLADINAITDPAEKGAAEAKLIEANDAQRQKDEQSGLIKKQIEGSGQKVRDAAVVSTLNLAVAGLRMANLVNQGQALSNDVKSDPTIALAVAPAGIALLRIIQIAKITTNTVAGNVSLLREANDTPTLPTSATASLDVDLSDGIPSSGSDQATLPPVGEQPDEPSAPIPLTATVDSSFDGTGASIVSVSDGAPVPQLTSGAVGNNVVQIPPASSGAVGNNVIQIPPPPSGTVGNNVVQIPPPPGGTVGNNVVQIPPPPGGPIGNVAQADKSNLPPSPSDDLASPPPPPPIGESESAEVMVPR